jgi:hypothetical protein
VWATSHALQPPSIVPRSMTGPCSVSHSTEPPPTYTKMAKVQLMPPPKLKLLPFPVSRTPLLPC